MFNLRQLKAFVTVAEQGSFTRAAKLLYMTQPAISAQIKSLEERLEIKLLERQDKSVLLTEAGEMLLVEAGKILTLYEEFVDAIDDLKGIRRGRVVIGASTIPGEYILPQLIGSFKKIHPKVEVVLKIADTSSIIDLIMKRNIDFGIIGAQVKVEKLLLQPVLKDNLILIAGNQHPLSKMNQVSVNDIARAEFILREPGSGTRMVIEQMLNEKNMRISDMNMIMELGSTRAVITAVEAGLGISLVSRLAADEALRLQLVKELHVDSWQIDRNLFLGRNESRYLSHAAQSFIDHILNQAKEE